jgi:hypothetical protein
MIRTSIPAIVGLAILLFLAMVGAMHILFDVAGGELSPGRIYVIAAIFALLMTPVIRALSPGGKG